MVEQHPVIIDCNCGCACGFKIDSQWKSECFWGLFGCAWTQRCSSIILDIYDCKVLGHLFFQAGLCWFLHDVLILGRS